MKLLYGPNSPYARKCRVVLREKKIACDEIAINSLDNPPELLAVNPLGKVPALVTDDGMALCDSAVICEYLDGLGEERALIPASGKARFEVLSLCALADGVMDLAVEWILQKRRSVDKQWPDWIERRREGILRALGAIMHHPMFDRKELNMGHINVACALEYLNFRHPELAWQEPYPLLASWLLGFERRESMKATQPKA